MKSTESEEDTIVKLDTEFFNLLTNKTLSFLKEIDKTQESIEDLLKTPINKDKINVLNDYSSIFIRNDELLPQIEKLIIDYEYQDSSNMHLSDLNRHKDKIETFNETYSSALGKSVNQLEETFTTEQKQLETLSKGHLWSETKKIRENINSTAEIYQELEKNPLLQTSLRDLNSAHIKQYLQSQPKREELMKKLIMIEEKYKTLDWTDASKPILKSFIDRKKGFLGLFRQEALFDVTLDDLINGLNKINYHEGVEEVDALKNEIQDTLDNFTEVFNAKKYILSTIKNEQSYLSSIKKSSEKMIETYPVLDKNTLSGMLKTYNNFQSSDFKEVKDMILFSDMIKPYYESRQRILSSIQNELTSNAKMYNDAFKSLKKESSSNSFLDNYEAFIKSVPESIYIGPKDKWLSEIFELRESIHQKEEESGKRRMEKQQIPATDRSAPDPNELLQKEAKAILDSLPDKISSGLAPLTADVFGLKEDTKSTKDMLIYLGNRIIQLEEKATQSQLYASPIISEISELKALHDRLYNEIAPISSKFQEFKTDAKTTNEIILNLENKLNTLEQRVIDQAPLISQPINPDGGYFKELPDTIKEIVIKAIQDNKPQAFEEPYRPRFGQNRIDDYIRQAPGKPPIKVCGDFLINNYLSTLDLNTNFMWFDTALRKGWEISLPQIKERFSEGLATNLRDYDYVQHLLFALGESRNRGEMASKHSRSTEFRELVDSTLISINDYLVRSEQYHRFTPRQIEEHRAMYGNQNQYNNELLCLSI